MSLSNLRMNFEIVDIEWEGPFRVSYDRDVDAYEIDSIPDTLMNSYGFYQIYGRHPVYGNDVILYIGESKKGKAATRSFKNRLREHLASRFYDHTNLSIYLGPCELSDEMVRMVESILIFSHAPALNRKYLDEPVDGTEKILIRNWGFVGSTGECVYWLLG